MSDERIHDIGDLVRLTANFTDIDGDPEDPSDAKFYVRAPSGAVTEIVGVDDSAAVGRWYADVEPTEWGRWWFRGQGTGAVTAQGERSFYVRRRVVPTPA